MITILNKAKSQQASVLLREIADAIEQGSLGKSEVRSESVSNAKGSIIVEVIIVLASGIAGNAAYDLIKALIRKAQESAKQRGEPPPEVEIKDETKDKG